MDEKSRQDMNAREEKRVQELFKARMQEEKREKLERYRRLNRLAIPGQILFVGSSLMEQFPICELLMDRRLTYTVYNRGIGGFTSSELENNLETCIFPLKPRKIFINIGTNDLNASDYTEDRLLACYRKILLAIRERLPETRIYIMAYFPGNAEAAEKDPYIKKILAWRTNEKIQSVNAALRKLSEELSITFINCNAGITNKEGRLKAEYTIEGMHMYADGYAAVLDAMLPYLAD